jgi:hypothetical protein
MPQPPGYVHQMFAATWAEVTVGATPVPGTSPLPLAAQLADDGATLVVRVVNQANSSRPLALSLAPAHPRLAGGRAGGKDYFKLNSGKAWTLALPAAAVAQGPKDADNTPAEPTRISPVETAVPVASPTSVAVTLRPFSVTVLTFSLAS